MRHYSCFLIVGLVIFAPGAWGQCAWYDKKPRTEVVIEPGHAIVDNSKPRQKFPMEAKETTLGLTVANITHQINLETDIQETPDHKYCMRLKKVKLIVSIPKLDVYIDKKYKPGSCQYSVISQHEQKHVRIHQDTLKGSRNRLQTALDASVKKLKPKLLRSNDDPDTITNNLLKSITQDVVPVIESIQKETDRKNKMIDTEKSYAAESRKCKKW